MVMVMEKNMEMKRFPTLAQVAKIASLLLLFSLAPLVPSSLRPPYLYLLFNALVVALGVEAGFLAAISGPRDDKLAKPVASSPRLIGSSSSSSKLAGEVVVAAAAVTSSSAVITAAASPLEAAAVVAGGGGAAGKKAKKIKASASKKMIMKRCPSRASIFFIGGGDGDHDFVHGGEEEDAGYGGGEQMMSKQELFTKAEAFIGNFYKQLKMQREESWKKLQDLYHHHHYYKTKAL